MKVSLERFLRTGQFGELSFGLPPQKVRELLGEPEATGGTSRRYSHPNIYLYGTVEIWFSRQPPYGVIGIFWDAEGKGAFRILSHCEIEDWAVTPKLEQTEIETLLSDCHLFDGHFEIRASETSTTWILSSGVHITFDENKRLISISSHEKE